MPEWDAELRVDETLARRLISEQFPEVTARSLRLLGEGWDNVVWLVDGAWVFRFPRRTMVVAGLENEIEYLPRLAPLLPLPVPVPTLIGRPSPEFRWPFYGAPFLPGVELAEAELDEDDRVWLGRPLGAFLRTLHALELDAELPVDPVRRADMTFRVPKTLDRFAELERTGLWTAPPAAREVVDAAARLGPPEPTAIVHGDLHLRHLLVDDGGVPSAVIDWIDLSRNDPGVDLVLYWCALPPTGRRAFSDAYGAIDEEQLLRGRILSLFLCGTLALWGRHEAVESVEREALAGLARTLNE
ncbi:MAG: phosphotransferase [Actinomycetota bacterium]|nr:phosphotransferase [Actinomycetota bacterium]